MSFFNKLLGFRDFLKQEQIKEFISSKFFLYQDESIINAEVLLFFETTRQKTWLIATDRRLFCVLDDIDKESCEVRWFLTKDQLIYENKVNLDIKINPNYKESIGLVDFGKNHAGWLYSKKIFPSKDRLNKIIIDLISSKMLTN